MRSPITRAEVVASFNHSIPNNWTVVWFGRPIAFSLTPFFYNRGWTANEVTAFRVGIALVACLAAAAHPLGAPLGALLFYVCFVLDCVDGNLARLHGTVTYFGKFLDGISDMLYSAVLPFAVGVGVCLHSGEAMYLIIGAAITIATLANQYVRTRLSFTREWMTGQSGPVAESVIATLQGVRKLQSQVAAIFVNGQFLATLLLFIPEAGARWYLLALVPLQLCCDLIWLGLSLREAQTLLDRPRRSIHAALPAESGKAPAAAAGDAAPAGTRAVQS